MAVVPLEALGSWSFVIICPVFFSLSDGICFRRGRRKMMEWVFFWWREVREKINVDVFFSLSLHSFPLLFQFPLSYPPPTSTWCTFWYVHSCTVTFTYPLTRRFFFNLEFSLITMHYDPPTPSTALRWLIRIRLKLCNVAMCLTTSRTSKKCWDGLESLSHLQTDTVPSLPPINVYRPAAVRFHAVWQFDYWQYKIITIFAVGFINHHLREGHSGIARHTRRASSLSFFWAGYSIPL